jgi:hypothetical protein
MVTWKKSHNEDPQVLHTPEQNLVVQATGVTATTDTVFCKGVLFQSSENFGLRTDTF